jgi:flagellin
MRVQHNIASMNSYRNYNNNTSQINKNLEKLSSGYRINRAGDDAAGLAISEKMRAQITGLEVAQKNAKDGISLVQTAEGALTEVHTMLNRMYSLAEQSANGTYDNTTDRFQLQKEVAALSKEIDRIADSANFNGQQLMDGSMSDSPAISMTQKGTYKIGTDTYNLVNDISFNWAQDATAADKSKLNAAFPSGTEITFTLKAGSGEYEISGIPTGYTAALPSGQPKYTGQEPTATYDIKDAQSNVVGTLTLQLNRGVSVSELQEALAPTAQGATPDITADVVSKFKFEGASTQGLTLQIGDTADKFNQLTVTADDIHTSNLGEASLRLSEIDISEQGNAQDAMYSIKAAINTISDIRGGLGATQNRLDHTINNLSVMRENLQDAESTIRDTDVADEMMKYTKNSILVQSAQAMLAQANQQPQGVLQLLQ